MRLVGSSSSSSWNSLDAARLDLEQAEIESFCGVIPIAKEDSLVALPFREIYHRLPRQLIHGDISPQNIVVSKGKPFLRSGK